MQIDRHLNLAIPLPRANGQTVFIHAQPLSSVAFKQHFEMIGLTHAALFEGGFGAASGPRIAAMLLEKIAKLHNAWEGPMGVANSLVAEIKRTTAVLMPAGSANRMLPIDNAVKTGVLSEKEADIVENALVFFTVISAMLRDNVLEVMLEQMAGMWGAQITSLSATEFERSLPTLTETGNSGESQEGLAKAS